MDLGSQVLASRWRLSLPTNSQGCSPAAPSGEEGAAAPQCCLLCTGYSKVMCSAPLKGSFSLE